MRLTLGKKLVLTGAGVLFGTWLAAHFPRVVGDEDGLLRLILGSFLSLLILLRWKPQPSPSAPVVPARPLIPAMMGAGLTVGGLIFRVHQAEWLGVVVLLYACLRWALPSPFRRDIRRALLLLYWVHPLPSQIFLPLQAAMQRLSVVGTEWVLHVLNVRIWADGLILRDGYRSFLVPEACSGMRTAVSVLLCTLGVGILLRLRWLPLMTFLLLSLVQVLLFNTARITGMVLWAPRMPPGWAETFLHDTLGIFLLLTLLLTQLEVSWWKWAADRRRQKQEAVERGERDRPDRATILPRFWRLVYRWWLWAMVALVALCTMALLAYKRRPSHRAAMMHPVLDGLLNIDLEAAERAIAELQRLTPRDRSLEVHRIQIMLLRGQYQEALHALEARASLSVQEQAYKGWALLALGRREEAARVLQALPESAARLPGVAILRAEEALLRDDAEAVARNLILARRPALMRRVRAMFPYLASRGHWHAIADVDLPGNYEDPVHALLAIRARLRRNDLASAALILKEALKIWPRDPRFLAPLFELSQHRPGSEWEERTAEMLLATLDQLSLDALSAYASDCFQLHRPELAWVVYHRIRTRDERDPALSLIAARHGDQWFTVRRRRLGLKAAGGGETVDLAGVVRLLGSLGRFRTCLSDIPLAEEMAWTAPEKIQAKYSRLCVQELSRREREETLTPRLEMMYPTVLVMVGAFDEAQQRLARLAERYPELAADFWFQRADIYVRQGRWQEAYEAVRQYRSEADAPSLSSYVLMVNVLLHLNLGIGALETCEQGLALFPHARSLRLAQASIWDTFGFRDQALFLAQGLGKDFPPPLLVTLLRDTGRIREAERKAGVLGLPPPGSAPQPYLLPAAEAALACRWPPPLSSAEIAEQAEQQDRQSREASSPFIGGLARQSALWLRSAGALGASPEAWEACGRDDLERACALHRLAVMQGRQQQYAEARTTVERALRHLPSNAVLRRMHVALAPEDLSAVEAARAACPRDPEIWLAHLVARVRSNPTNAVVWTAHEIQQATTAGMFPIETIVRAGSFLVREGRVEAGVAAARHAHKHARGLVPAYVVAIQAALVTNDLDWAIAAAVQGAAEAVDPAPFYRTIADLKAARRSTDADFIAALEYLRERFPAESQWTEYLGMVYFQKRDLRRSLNLYQDLLRRDPSRLRLESWILAAETARLEGQTERAIAVLENAYSLYPNHPAILNNLVYLLAQNDRTLPRALELLPKLLAQKTPSFAVLDTAAMVSYRAGQLEQAKSYMEQALQSIDPKAYAAAEVLLNAGRIWFRLGQYEEARELFERVRRDPARSDAVDLEARELLAKIREMKQARR